MFWNTGYIETSVNGIYGKVRLIIDSCLYSVFRDVADNFWKVCTCYVFVYLSTADPYS